ncbi:MAG: hypothetical protein EZS26_000771 [Candidatus Ordinivivax streblomastigis]|uniref:Uncharacterized protein n=1 Tax=Candidatus Ordinivivax streblomastigis TaxID=2540710 RepID=A0A5M8P459_9BACT|nr:MAG: hypothetical protein EZS26_000771 [Candidatus Ordinivivax streblomastigis]
MTTESELLEIAKEIILLNKDISAGLTGSLLLYNMGIEKRRPAKDIDIIVWDLCESDLGLPTMPIGWNMIEMNGSKSEVDAIQFEKDTLWRMYGTGGKLLSGIPIHELGTVKREDVKSKQAAAVSKRAGKPIEIMPFGKHKGELIRDIPADYKKWALANIEWHSGNMNLKQALS